MAVDLSENKTALPFSDLIWVAVRRPLNLVWERAKGGPGPDDFRLSDVTIMRLLPPWDRPRP